MALVYLAVTNSKTPPKVWLAEGITAGRISTFVNKAKAVGNKTIRDYVGLASTWAAFAVDAPTAERARTVLSQGLAGSDLARGKITVLTDRYDLTRHLNGPAAERMDHFPTGPLPARLRPAPPPPRFTIGSPRKNDPLERVDRERGVELTPDSFEPAALFMGFYSQAGTNELEGMPGVRFNLNYTAPCVLLYVVPKVIGYANIPVIEVSGATPNVYNSGIAVDVCRPLAVAFAKAHNLVFDLYKPSIRQGRKRLYGDQNPQSSSYGKDKFMEEFQVTFEVPLEQLRRMTKDQQGWFRYGMDALGLAKRPRWGKAEIAHWLGTDKVTQIAAIRGVAKPKRAAQVAPARVQAIRPDLVLPEAKPAPVVAPGGLDGVQVAAGCAWAAAKVGDRAKAIEIADKKLPKMLGIRNKSFWSGVRSWGLGEC